MTDLPHASRPAYVGEAARLVVTLFVDQQPYHILIAICASCSDEEIFALPRVHTNLFVMLEPA